MSYPTSGGQPFATGLYWRKSLLNGRKCVPVILILGDGVLSMSDTSGPVFSVAVRDIGARVSRWGTLLLTLGGSTYALVGRGGEISPSFTREQTAQLAKLGAGDPPGPTGPDRAGATRAMLHNTTALADKLRESGAAVQ